LLSWGGSPDSHVDIQPKNDGHDADTPVLQLRERRAKQEFIEEELVQHGQVSQNLELAGFLVLERHQFARLCSNYR